VGESEEVDILCYSYHPNSASIRTRLDADILKIDFDLMGAFETNG